MLVHRDLFPCALYLITISRYRNLSVTSEGLAKHLGTRLIGLPEIRMYNDIKSTMSHRAIDFLR